MADFAPNYTARYKIGYSAYGLQHTMLWRIERGTGGTGAALMVAKVGDFLTTLATALVTNFVVQTAEYAPEDVDVFAPFTLPTHSPGTAVIAANPLSQSTLSCSFVGRSSSGQKARMFLWGVQISPEITPAVVVDNFRVLTSESAPIAAAIAELNSGGPTIVGSDNLPVQWYSYVNTKYSDHWVAKIRG